MLHTFKSFDDAIAAGYTKANRKHGTYRGCTIRDRDTSGANAVGYSYAVVASIPATIDGNRFVDIQSPDDFGSSVQVWTEDLNKIHQPGSFSVMYAPAHLSTAIEMAHAWVDAYYTANPESAARLAQLKADQAASDARHAAKKIGRQVRRNARMTAAAL